jgi:FeS assembly SUF system protein
MKPLPVIQPPPSSPAPAGTHRLQTAHMVNDPQKSAELGAHVINALSSVFDPEIPVNIYELGLIYEVIVDTSAAVGIRMTLTAPGCPAAQVLPDHVKNAVARIPGVRDVAVDVVWDPPWTRDRMSEAARLQLGMF